MRKENPSRHAKWLHRTVPGNDILISFEWSNRNWFLRHLDFLLLDVIRVRVHERIPKFTVSAPRKQEKPGKFPEGTNNPAHSVCVRVIMHEISRKEANIWFVQSVAVLYHLYCRGKFGFLIILFRFCTHTPITNRIVCYLPVFQLAKLDPHTLLLFKEISQILQQSFNFKRISLKDNF